MALNLSGTSGITGAGIGTIGPSGSNITGVVTCTSVVSSGAVSGTTGTFSGALSGTTGTFTSHVSLGDSNKLRLGAEPDLDIYHSGSNAFFENVTGNIYFRNDGAATYFQMGSSNETSIVLAKDDYVGLYFNGGEKLATTATGVTLKSGAANTTKVIIGSTANRGLEISTVSDGSNNDAQVEFNAADTTSSGYHANLVFKLADVEKARFHGNGDYFQLSSTCTGITFNGDHAAVNQLNDYEEGTWTPSIGTTSGATATGEYRKIGKAVFIQMYVSIPSHSNSSTMSIAGLPFSAMSGKYSSFVIGNFRFFNHDGGYTTLRVNQAGTTMTFRETGDSQSWQNAEWSQVQADFAMYVSGTYFTD